MTFATFLPKTSSQASPQVLEPARAQNTLHCCPDQETQLTHAYCARSGETMGWQLAFHFYAPERVGHPGLSCRACRIHLSGLDARTVPLHRIEAAFRVHQKPRG